MPPKITQKRAAMTKDSDLPPPKKAKSNRSKKTAVTVVVSVQNEASQSSQPGPSQDPTGDGVNGTNSNGDSDVGNIAVDAAPVPQQTPEQELADLVKKMTSSIYAFWDPIPELDNSDGRPSLIFQCSNKSCGHKSRRYMDTKDNNSTGNLHRHTKVCWGEEAHAAGQLCKNSTMACKEVVAVIKRSGSIAAAFQRMGDGKESYSNRQRTPKETRAEMVRWVSVNLRPFAIVDDLSFRSLMKTGRPDHYLPSAKIVSRDVKSLFVKTRTRIAKLLQTHQGALSFATDAWTSPNHRAYVGITAHFVIKGVAACMILDIIEVPQSHTGDELALVFANAMEEFGIGHKILGITCDSAAVNNRMIGNLAILLPGFPGCANQTRCFSHVLNLVAKGIIKLFDPPKRGSNNPIDESNTGEVLLDRIVSDLEESLELEDNVDEDSVGEEEMKSVEASVLSVSEREQIEEEILPVRLVVAKIRKLAFKIVNSSTILLPAWKNTLKEMSLSERLIPRDVQTRWNSTYDMLDFVVEYQRAIEVITSNRGNDLRDYELDKNEWKIIKDLRKTLKVFKDGTLFFCRATPSLATVIPAMDHIDQFLTDASLDKSISPAVRVALNNGKKILNHYYDLTDSSEVYRIAMVLHPRHKLQYFKQAKWEEGWIQTARELVRTEFDRSYATHEDATEEESGMEDIMEVELNGNMFDQLETLAAPHSSELRDDLDRYLSTDPEKCQDPLRWWYEHSETYPNLSRMALDYLSIPATSVDVERLFSKGRLVLSHIRSRLSAQSTRALICLGNWSVRNLVRDSDVDAVVAEPSDGSDAELPDGWDAIHFV